MRVLALAESFFGDIPNGLARVAWDVCRELARRGHVVDLVCPSGVIRDAFETSEIDGVRVTRYARPQLSGLNPANPWNHTNGYAATVRHLATRSQWDLVHCHGIYAMAAAAKSLPRLARVWTIHSPAVLEQAWNWTHGRLRDWLKIPGLVQIRSFESRAMKSATVCHTLSCFTRDAMEKLYPSAFHKPWRVIGHWADDTWKRRMPKEDARRLLGWPIDERVVLSVRQLKPRYGLDVALTGLAPLLRFRRCVLRICGDGVEAPRLRSLARALGIADRVVFEGHVSESQLRLCYQAADVCVVPTIAMECFGLISLEAYAAGVPVVATFNGAIPEVVGPVTPELLVPPRDARALGLVVGELLCGTIPFPPPLHLEGYAATQFNVERSLAAYEQMYEDAIRAN